MARGSADSLLAVCCSRGVGDMGRVVDGFEFPRRNIFYLPKKTWIVFLTL